MKLRMNVDQLCRQVTVLVAVCFALLFSHVVAKHSPDALMAMVPISGSLTAVQVREKREQLMREAAALKSADGSFPNDDARRSFDAKVAEVEQLDAQLRELEKAPPGATNLANADAIRSEGIAAERARASAIEDAVRIAKLEPAVAEDMKKRGIPIEAARAEIFAKLAAKDQENPTHPQVRMGADEKDKFARGAQAWLLQRSGLAGIVSSFEKTDRVTNFGEFRGMTLLDLARECLSKAGVSTRGMDRMQIAGLAFSQRNGGNYQTPSDFTVLLENTMHKILRAAYGMTPDTWSIFCATGTVVDFRAHNWYRTGALSELDSLSDTGEFKNKAIPDGEKVTYSVSTKGNIIAFSRQTIVNDDLGAVMQMTQRLGRAGKLTIEKAVYALLAQNAGLGPTYGSAPLFDATHGNISTGAALSAAAIDADRVAMAQQMEPNSSEYADLRPAILLVPVSLGGQARIINTSQYDPDTTANKAQMKPNVVAGLFRQVVDTPRLSGTRRYLFADPSIAPAIMVSFLEGQQEPVLETEAGWRIDGVEMKARLDVGVDAVDYRGALTNAGV